MKPIISGIQQVGIGIPDVYKAFEWYRKTLGFDVPIFDDPGKAELMLPYTGGQPQSRHAILAMNMQGGGGLEIWQYTSRTPQAAKKPMQLGDLGINMMRVKTADISQAYHTMADAGEDIVSIIETLPSGVQAFCLRDLYGNLIRVEQRGDKFMKTDAAVGGLIGVVIGVEDIDAAVRFYKEVLGYNDVIYDKAGDFEDFEDLPSGGGAFRRVMLSHKAERKGAFSRLLGRTGIELVQTMDRAPKKIFEGRFWGDLGYIHLCFDIRGMADMRTLCAAKGCPFTVDSNPDDGTFDMGEAAGSFAYTEDPSGTLIEFVEAHKVPIMKKLNWNLDMKKRDPEKPLPNWMLKALRLGAKK